MGIHRWRPQDGWRILHDIANMDTIVHMPRIGCGLAGGKWEEVEPIITEELSRKDVAVYVYDLE